MIEAVAWEILVAVGIASNIAHLWMLAERRPFTEPRTLERAITNAYIALELLLLVMFGIIAATGVVIIDALVNSQRGFNWSVTSDGAPRAVFTSYGFLLIALILVVANVIRGKMWTNMERCFHLRKAMGRKILEQDRAAREKDRD